MAVVRSNGPARKADEICDYCYHGRVENIRVKRLNQGYIRYEAPEVAVCVCGPTAPCRDHMCAFYA